MQLCATANVPSNLEKAEHLVGQAATAGTEVVFLPESFAYIGSDRGLREHAESMDSQGPILEACASMAQTHNVHLIAGGLPESAPDGRTYNSCMHFTPQGTLVAHYRKIHLFDVDLSDGTRMMESRSTAPGQELVTTQLPFGVLGLSVCYDIRFPLLYQELVDRGAIALAIPAAFMKTTGKAHWNTLIRARAIECQSYVIAAAQYGDHGHRGRKSYGHAIVADPWGNVIAECVEQKEDVAIAEISATEVERIRTELPSLKNRGSWT